MNFNAASSTGTFRPLMRLAWPVLAEQCLGVMVGFVDMALTGHILIDEAYIAAIGSNAYLMWLMLSLFSAVSIGATALTSRFIGEKDPQQASLAANQAFLLGMLFAVAITILFYFGSPTLVRLLQLEGDAAKHAVRYLAIVSLFVPAIMVQQVGIACLRGAGDTVSGFFAMSLVNIVNIVVSYALCIGLGPLPALGWDGIALGTAMGHLVGGTTILLILLRGRAGLKLQWSQFRLHPEMIRRLLRIGIPGGADVLMILFCHLWFVAIIFSLGTTAAAAHGLAIRVESLAYLPGTAFQVAAATLAGQFLGAKDPQRATESVWLACIIGGGLMTVAALAFYFAGPFLVWAFVGNAENAVGVLTVELLKIVAWCIPLFGMWMVQMGALRGAGDTRWPLVFSFIGFLFVRIPGAYLLSRDVIEIPWLHLTLVGAGWGVHGAWWAMTSDVVVRSLLVLARFLHGGWRKVQV